MWSEATQLTERSDSINGAKRLHIYTRPCHTTLPSEFAIWPCQIKHAPIDFEPAVNRDVPLEDRSWKVEECMTRQIEVLSQLHETEMRAADAPRWYVGWKGMADSGWRIWGETLMEWQ